MVLNLVVALFDYLLQLVLHKWFIIVAGLWINRKLSGTGFRVTWKRMILHDLSKFTPSELLPYVRNFKTKSKTHQQELEFQKAWKHHYENNDHHHEHFYDETTKTSKLMSEEALLELFTDLFAAQRAYDKRWPQKGKWNWIERKFEGVISKMHPANATFLTGLLVKFGFEEPVMKSLGKEGKSFDWEEAMKVIKEKEPSWLKRFQTLYNHQIM